MTNEELKTKYNEMHTKGVGAWFSAGADERQTILKMGEPWLGTGVLEIGCGEGELARLMSDKGAIVLGIDYSQVAIDKAKPYEEYMLNFECIDYHNVKEKYDYVVMQGVLEHLDDPFKELKWMMDNLVEDRGDMITSSPCFLNPRGVVWMTLNMLGAVMSKTDLHYLNPNDFADFCIANGYKLGWTTCDSSWGFGTDMIKDLRQRIPLALRDGNIPWKQERLDEFIRWLSVIDICSDYGATAVYKIGK